MLGTTVVLAADVVVWTKPGASGTAKIAANADHSTYTLTVDAVTANGVIDGVPTSGTVGTGVTATVTSTESYGQVNKTVLALAAVPVAVTYGGSGTNSVGGTKVYDFPAGRLLVLGVTVDNFTIGNSLSLGATDGGDFSFGTATASGTNLSSTAVDLCPKTSIDPITNRVDAALAASAQFDGTSTAKDMYVNLLIDANDMTNNATPGVTGTVTIHWLNLGDY
jgi:hypothetical protein